jgi:hypothetical protein
LCQCEKLLAPDRVGTKVRAADIRPLAVYGPYACDRRNPKELSILLYLLQDF